jgi:OMF family outer membrane factor
MKQIFAFVFFAIFTSNGQEMVRFTNPNEVLRYATQHNIALKSGDVQIALAKYQIYNAKINRFNPRATIGYGMTDNFQLPVNFLPAEVFGGTMGTFKEAKFGQQYLQNLTISPQIDLINYVSWAKLEAVKTNELLSEINRKLVKKTMSESVIAIYFNIISFQEQLKILNQTQQNADTILQIVIHKYQEGIIRSQDVNHANVNKLLIQERILHMQNGLEQQYNLLKSWCDVPVSTEILIVHQALKTVGNQVVLANLLKTQQTELLVKYTHNDLKMNQVSYYPTLSIIGSWALQENSNNRFFDGNTRWIPQSYVGLRINVVVPDAYKFSQTQQVKTSLQLAEFNAQKQALQQGIEQKQLQLEYDKAMATEQIAQTIVAFKKDTYQKNFNLFKQNIYPTENLLLSFNEVLNATINQQVATIQIAFQQEKININNSIQ